MKEALAETLLRLAAERLYLARWTQQIRAFYHDAR